MCRQTIILMALDKQRRTHQLYGGKERTMTRRDEAIAIMKEMLTCIPRDFFSKMDEVSRGTGFVLAYLDEAETEVFPSDIARDMNVSTARIAAMLRQLEKNGFITRESSSQDGRKTVVTLTKLGRTWIQRTKEQAVDKTELLLERVGSEDIQDFIRLSKKIKAALEA